MEEEKLDQLLKNKLESLETLVPEDAWHSFSAKLKDAELQDTITGEEKFDFHIHKKLNHIILPAKEKYAWAYFNEYFSRVKRNERRIVLFKAMELMLVTMIFITFLQIDALVPNQFYQPPLRESEPSAFQNQEIPENVSGTLPKLMENRGLNPPVMEETSTTIYYSGIKKEPVKVKQMVQNLGLNPLPMITHSSVKQLKSPVSLPVFSKVEEIPTLALNSIPLTTKQIYIRNILDFGKWHLTLRAGLDGDHVSTPENQRFRLPQTERNSAGYQLGFLLSEGARRLETGFGFIYANKDYRAPAVTFIQGSLRDGYTSEQLKRIQLNLLQIPVFTRLNLVHKEKWKFYASLGAVAQLTLSADYYIVHPGFFPSTVALTGKRNSFYQNLEEGILQGGAMFDNINLSMDANIGLEKMVAPKTGIFLQVGYQQFLGHTSKGIGPYNDRISTLSMQSGVRFKLFPTEN